MNEYSQEILKVLLQVPEGLSAKKISRHVFNAVNTFFSTYNYGEVHRDVLNILQKWSSDDNSYVERAERKGYYRIRTSRKDTCQLMFTFHDDKNEQQPVQQADTGELSLF